MPKKECQTIVKSLKKHFVALCAGVILEFQFTTLKASHEKIISWPVLLQTFLRYFLPVQDLSIRETRLY